MGARMPWSAGPWPPPRDPDGDSYQPGRERELFAGVRLNLR